MRYQHSRHTRHGFFLIVVIVLLGLAVVAETLATRYLIDLNRHIHHRQQAIQRRVDPTGTPAPDVSRGAPREAGSLHERTLH